MLPKTQAVSLTADASGMETRTALPTVLPARRIVAVALAATAAFVATIGAAPASADAAPVHVRKIDRVEATEVAMINRFRRARGLRPLRVDGRLTRAAGWHATNLGMKRIFGHVDSLGRDPFSRLRAFGYPSGGTWRGENVAAGNAGAGPTYRQWLNSPPHRANWENPHYRAIGIARVRVKNSPYGYYWVTTFGSAWTGPSR